MKTENKAILKKLSPLMLIVLATILLAWSFASGAFNRAIYAFWPDREADRPSTTINKEVSLQNVLPKDMHGVWLVEGIDYPVVGSPKEDITAEIDAVFASLVSLHMDTVFVSASSSSLVNSGSGSDFDILKYIFESAEKENIYCILSLPVDVLFSDVQNLHSDNEKILEIIQEYRPSAVMLDGLDQINFEPNENEDDAEEEDKDELLLEKTSEICSVIKAVSPSSFIGFSAAAFQQADTDAPSSNDEIKTAELFDNFYTAPKKWLTNSVIDFVYLHPSLKKEDRNPSLIEFVEWWDSLIKNTNAYGILGIEAGSNSKTEFIDQASLVSPLQSFCGLSFNSYQGFMNDESAKNDYLAMLNSANIKNLKTGKLAISRPAAKRIITNELTVSFMGTADPSFTLYCNGIEIPKSSLGLFSVSLSLRAGENEFTFTHNNISLTYTVIYELDILSEVNPAGKTEAVGGTLINIYALAYKEAEVHALVGSTEIKMLPSTQNVFGQSAAPSDFVTFSGSFALPFSTSKLDYGNIQFVATYNGITARLEGGDISSLPQLTAENIRNSELYQVPTNYVSLYSEKSLPLKTPFQNHGLGTALMCEVLKDYAETTPADAANKKSSPFYRPLLKGSFDYIDSIATYDDNMFYILSSGRKIYAKDAKIIPDANKLPTNSLSVRSSKTRGETEFIIKTDWIVPISALISPQSYFVGYDSAPYSVHAFTGQYLDITFHYTSAASGRFNVWGSNLIDNAKWINVGHEGNATLRIQLKNAGQFYGYSVNITDNGEYKITVKNRSDKLNKKVIVLDPGHGGKDPGAIGVYSTIYESHLNLLIAQKTKAELERMGATVIMTREADTNLSLDERILMTRRYNPDLFISIHHDASTSSVNSGTHTFYYTSYSMALAKAIHNNIVNAYVQNQIIPQNTAEYAKIDLGIKFYPFAVVRVEECPSVLVECGFLTNAVNASGLLNEGNQNAIASAIANGIKEYFYYN